MGEIIPADVPAFLGFGVACSTAFGAEGVEADVAGVLEHKESPTHLNLALHVSPALGSLAPGSPGALAPGRHPAACGAFIVRRHGERGLGIAVGQDGWSDVMERTLCFQGVLRPTS